MKQKLLKKSLLKSYYPSCMKHSKLLTKSIHQQLYAMTHLNDWLFFTPDLSQIEIAQPSLETITFMKEYGLTFVLKGFKNKIEYIKFDNLRVKLGIATSMLLFKMLDSNSTVNILTNFLNNNTLPDSNEILSIVDKNKFVNISDDKGLRLIADRNKWKNRQEKYSHIVRKQIFNLIKQNRISSLSL